MAPRSIAIAGCGVAGLALAALLAREGVRVVVFDKLRTPEPLGSGLILQPVGLAVLDQIGVGSRIRELGAPIKRLFGKTEPAGRIVLDVRYDALGEGAATGLAVHRGALFQLLHEAALTAGAEMAPGHDVVATDGVGRLLFAGGKVGAQFDLVVDALGVRSPLSSEPKAPLPYGALWANLDWPDEGDRKVFDPHALEQRYERARRMVGVMPIGSLPGSTRRQAAFFWSVRHAERRAWAIRPLDNWKEEVRALWPDTAPLLDQISNHDQMVFAAYAHRTLASPLGRGVVHIGDSWHSASPQLGQGANMALLDALALARSLETHADLAGALKAYVRARAWQIWLYQAASWAFTPAYQSDSALLSGIRDWVMAPVSRVWPAPKVLAGLVAGVLGAPLQQIRAISAAPPQPLSTTAASH